MKAARRTDPASAFFDTMLALPVLLLLGWTAAEVLRWPTPACGAAAAMIGGVLGLPVGLQRARGLTALGAAAVLVAAMLVVLASAAFATLSLDLSADGMAYHQVGVLALRDGWNPWLNPHLQDWGRAAEPPGAAWLARLALPLIHKNRWTNFLARPIFRNGSTKPDQENTV